MGREINVPSGDGFETRNDKVAKKAAKKAYSDRSDELIRLYGAPADATAFGKMVSTKKREEAYEDKEKDEDLIKKHGGTNAMKSKSFATKRYMNGGMVMSGRGVRDTKMS